MDKKQKAKAKKVARVATNTTAGLVGNVLRLSFKIVLTILLIIITTGLLFATVFAYYVKTSLATELDLSLTDFTLELSSTMYYYDSNGAEREMVTLQSVKTRFWVDYEDIPIYMEYAAVAIEDKRFYEHKGVDWYRTLAAFRDMFMPTDAVFGGSTLTQQLIKNLTDYDDVTVQRKLLEIFRALEFEKQYTKDEIIEWYLNSVYFGESSYGIGAAALAYFDKEPSQLTIAECASIVAITNNPSIYSPTISEANNKERRHLILHEMYTQNYITYDEYIAAVNENVIFQRGENEEYEMEIYTYYEEVVINDVIEDLVKIKGYSYETARQLVYNGGYQIYACIDKDIQDVVDNLYQNRELMPQGRSSSGELLQSAIVVLDPYTGAILALSGGIGEKTVNFGLNRVYSKRQPGSSIKPIAVYGPAFDQGLITQDTTVSDAPGKLSNTTWFPTNASGGYRGTITIRTAITWSINTVAAQTLDVLTLDTSYYYMTERLGVTSLVERDEDGNTDIAYSPLSMGGLTNGITVREMAQAYSAFANDGVFTYARSYSKVVDSEGNVVLDNSPETIIAFKANTAWNITDCLYAAVQGGTGTEARLSNMPAAGKTGTTTQNYDRYFVGYTPYYLAAVWTGYDTPATMSLSGNPATQIWYKVMSQIHDGLEYKSFPTPTKGSPTGIFGHLSLEEETESPEVTETVSPTASETPSPTPSATTPPTTSPVQSQTPATPVPVTTAPVTQTPVTQTPVTQTPVTQTPATQNPAGPTAYVPTQSP